VLFRRRFDQPSTAVRFIYAARVMTRRRNFRLPASDLCPLDARAEKDAAVTVGFLLKFRSEFKITVRFFCREITVFLVGTTFRNKQSILDIPLFRAIDLPAREVFPIE